MKTKISHLGRSSVSVILAVMMLLSTMLVGTVSTVNATVSGLSEIYFTPSTNWAQGNANFRLNVQDSNNNWQNIKMTKIDESVPIYRGEIDPNTSYNVIQFLRYNPNDDNDQWDYSNTCQSIPTGKNYYTMTTASWKGWDINTTNGTWSTYSAAAPVADSVSLTASSLLVQVGTEVTLTASLNNKATDLNDADVTYTFEQTSGATVTGTPTGNTYKFTPNTAGDYTFKVTASAANYSSVTNTVTVTATSPTTTYAVNYGVSGGNGNLTATGTGVTGSGSDVVDSGTKVTFTAQPNDGYVVDGWYSDAECKNAISGAGNNTSYEVIVNANTDVYVKFKATAIDPEYRLVGNLPGLNEWNDYNKALKFDTAESDGSYSSKEITITNDDLSNNRKYFRLIKSVDGSYKQYGPYITENDKQDVDICGFAASNPYVTYENNDKAFYFSKAGKYKIHYKKTGNTPSVWVEETTTKYYTVTVANGVSAIVNPEKAAAGETVTVTATPGTGEVLDSVTVEGADGSTIETAVSGNTATFVMPDQDVTVTNVTFRDANKYTVNFSSSDPTNGKVSAQYNGADFATGTKVTEGDTVTFTATPISSGYTFKDWTVTVNNTPQTYTGSSLYLKITANTTVVANFKVEDSGTIVNDMYFLYGSKDDPTKWEGMQAYDKPGYGKYNVYEKDGKYIVTLNKEHYKQLYFAFSKYDFYQNMVPNAGLIDVKSENPEGLSLVNAKIQPYNVYGVEYKFGQMNIVSENSDNIGDIKIIYDPDAKTYTVKATKDSVSDTTVNIVGKDGTVREGYYDKTTSALGDTELTVTSTDGTTITAIDSCNFDGHYQGVTAKKVPYGSEVTVKTTINPNATFAGHSGSEYYVKGFSINGFTGGVLTQEAGNSHEGDVYEYTFTVKKDVYADVSTIEITPIYFLRDDLSCVTFYVENFMDAKAKWGDTIACYAYYSDGDNSGNALGGYPGQPMVNAEGSIYMQIPKHIGNDTTNVVKGITLNNYVWDFVHVSGGDDVRKQKNCQTYDYDDFKYLANMSQVNSSDSASDIKNIVYRFKYHTYNNTSADAGNVPKDTLTATTVDTTKYEVFVDYYDKPTDIFGTIINGNDAVTVDTVKEQQEYLTIVSDGYVNYYNDTANYLGQYATKWYIYNKEDQKVAALPPSALLYGLTKSSTELKDLVNKVEVPLDFMSDSGANADVISGYWDSFKSLYTAYAGKYAIINYESAIYSSGRDKAQDQPGERCDGRWYYSVDRANITGDIKIEYADTLDSFTTMTGVETDTFKPGTATGTITAAEAYFTSPAGQSTTDKPTHVETTSDNSENFMFTVGATSSTTSGYTFVGWYRLIDDTYKAVNDPSELNKTTGQVARNANVVLVARYIKTPGGSMTFHHSLYNGTNAGGGKATTEIQVVVKSSDGSKVYYNSGRIDSTASIDKKTISDIVTAQLTDQQDAKITVTLYTTTKNLYNFNCYYSAENTTNITAFPPSTADFTTTVSGDRTNGRVTESVYTFSFNEYYKTHQNTLIGDDAGTVYYNFYSDITSIKVPYKVQFSYIDRMEEQKYYNRAGYVDPDNTSSYTFDEIGNDDVKVTLTDSFILTLAPYESNFTKNLTWNKTPDSNTPFDSSATNSIASAVVNSDQSPRTIHLKIYKDSEGNPTPRTNTKGHFELFTKDGSAKFPYGSVFYTKNNDGTYTYDITAKKTYTDEDGTHQFMYWEIYSDEECKPEDLVIKAYNSEGHFSYVAYDNCWIVPVYGESSTPSASVKEVYTSTQFMEVTRNQWTAENAESFTTGFDVDTMTTLKDFKTDYGEDKLYADFVLNFFYNGKQLSVFDPDSKKVEAGVLIQRLDLDKNDTTGYITDLNHYANNKFTSDQLDVAKKDAIDKITTGNSVITSVKQKINNSRLDNKNRLQYYTRFNNVKGNNDCVFRLYTYIQYTGADGKPVVELSDPVYFTFYDIANKS